MGEADGLPGVEDDGGRVIGSACLGQPGFDVAELDWLVAGSCPGVDPVEHHGVVVEVTDHRGGEVRFQSQVEA